MRTGASSMGQQPPRPPPPPPPPKPCGLQTELKYKRDKSGGAAKSIQSINVAAVVAVAAAAAGLASPAATHYMKKLRVWRKTALLLSLFLFFLEQPSFFPHVHAHPELVQWQGWANEKIFFFKKIHYFLLGIFWWEYGASAQYVFASFCAFIFKCWGPTSPRTPSAILGSLALYHRVQRTQ